MSKLDPKPNQDHDLYSWDHLNRKLQASFGELNIGWAVIDCRKYSIPKDEIAAEAESQGYKVIGQDEHHLRFE